MELDTVDLLTCSEDWAFGFITLSFPISLLESTYCIFLLFSIIFYAWENSRVWVKSTMVFLFICFPVFLYLWFSLDDIGFAKCPLFCFIAEVLIGVYCLSPEVICRCYFRVFSWLSKSFSFRLGMLNEETFCWLFFSLLWSIPILEPFILAVIRCADSGDFGFTPVTFFY